MIAADKQDEIRRRLRRAESGHQVKVLLAVESGSRAWGFASPDSDYDARFIYVNRPEWYLSVGLEEQRDVIEYPIIDEMDINGWDLRKALRLFRRSNPGFVEWLQSPLVYETSGSFAARARAAPHRLFGRTRRAPLSQHGEDQFPGLPATGASSSQEIFLRPAALARGTLAAGIPHPRPDRVRTTAAPGRAGHRTARRHRHAACRQRVSPELGLAPQVPAIQRFIVTELARLETLQLQPAAQADAEPLLSDLFRDLLRETWG